jgi:hypothetical protein
MKLFRNFFILGSSGFGLFFEMRNFRLFFLEFSREFFDLKLIFLDSDNKFTVLLTTSVEVFGDLFYFLFERLDFKFEILSDFFGDSPSFLDEIVFTEFFLRVGLFKSIVLLNKIFLSKVKFGNNIGHFVMLLFKSLELFDVSVQLILKRSNFILIFRNSLLMFLYCRL